jgi:hypothetical protein
MVRLQRQTSFFTAALVAIALAGSGLACGWYLMSGTLTSVSAKPESGGSPGLTEVAYGAVWGKVYLTSLLAGLVLVTFAAKGTRLWCSAAIVAAALVGLLLGVLAIDWVGA